MSRCISSHGEYSAHVSQVFQNRCDWCRVWTCPECDDDLPYPLDERDHECETVMSEEPYTPTTDQLRHTWSRRRRFFTTETADEHYGRTEPRQLSEFYAEFDRWFAAEIAKAQADARLGALDEAIMALGKEGWYSPGIDALHRAAAIREGEKR